MTGREIKSSIILKTFKNNKFGCYNLIVNLNSLRNKNKSIPFFVKIFSNKNIQVNEMPLTISQNLKINWDV